MMFRLGVLTCVSLSAGAVWLLVNDRDQVELVERLTAPVTAGESRFTEQELTAIRADIVEELAELESDVTVSVESLRSERVIPNPVSNVVPSTTTTTLVPADARCPEWWVVAIGAGWPEDRAVLEVLDWIIWAESRCQPDAIGDGSYGLTQIQWSVHDDWIVELGFERDELLEPATNLALAYQLYRTVDQDSAYRCGFSPWYMSQPGRHWCDVLDDLS